jgi:RNA polymerase sigma-70 factor (ECF subfamily)
MSEDHRQVVQRASSGDPVALDELVARSLPDLHAYVRRRSGRALRRCESVSDVVQSVCRQVLEQLADFEYRGEAAFRAWLFEQARHKIIDHVRYQRARRRDRGRETWLGDAVAGADAVTPSQAAIGAELSDAIDAAMLRIGPSERELILQARLIGLSHAEIAQQLGVTRTVVKVRLHRAIARLSRYLPDPNRLV